MMEVVFYNIGFFTESDGQGFSGFGNNAGARSQTFSFRGPGFSGFNAGQAQGTQGGQASFSGFPGFGGGNQRTPPTGSDINPEVFKAFFKQQKDQQQAQR